MTCDKCGRGAVMHAAYSGQDLCEEHFLRSVETRVRGRVREDNLLPIAATPEDPQTWIVGLSGGKDSVSLTTILHETFAEDPRVELRAVSIQEGIEGYRDRSIEAAREVAEDLNIPHEVLTYEEEFGVEMDEIAQQGPEEMSACGYCGVFRRDILARYAASSGADKLLTGHNLDDESETAMMNFLEGNINQIAKHFHASLGPFPGSEREVTRNDSQTFVPRAKPLRDVPEPEVSLYAQLRDLPVHSPECPHSEESYRGEIEAMLTEFEERHPGARYSIMSGYEELAAMVATARDDDTAIHDCEQCGRPTRREVCRKCTLLDGLS